MYLFNRMTRLAPTHFQDGLAWAVSVTEKVNQITALDVGLWSPTMSAGFGTLTWGTAVPTLTDLEDAEAKLNVDPMYLDLVQQGAGMTIGGVDDEVAQFLVGGDGPLPFDPTHVAVVRSQLANGNLRRGIEAGVKIAEAVTRISGAPTAFLLASTGAYGGCAWLTVADSLRQLEVAEQAANSDPEFLALVDESSDCYLPGVTTQAIWRRIV